MKIYKNTIIGLSIILIITSCDSDNPYISNDISSIEYTANFKPDNAGEKKYSVKVKWDKYNGENALYEIFDSNNDLISSTNSKNDTTLTIDMELNQIKVVLLSVNTLASSEIKIFSRPISPPTNLTISATSESNSLSWTSSTDNDIQQTIVYRAELQPSEPLPLINDLEGTPDENIWTIIKQGNASLSSYLDTSINTSFNYYYTVKVIDSSGGYRYSYMASNINGSVESGSLIGLDDGYQINLQSSEEHPAYNEIYPNKTFFLWQDYVYDDFYEFQIWKSEENNFEINSNGSSLLISITDPEVVDFQDYNDIGQGKTWYYKIRINNIYGNYTDSEIITCQTSL